MNELKPCPFCGHEEPYFERLGSPRQSCIVACGSCGCQHESSDEDEMCGASWNERASTTPLPAVQDAPTLWETTHPGATVPLTKNKGVVENWRHFGWPVIEYFTQPAPAAPQGAHSNGATIAEYEEMLTDQRRLVRELDVPFNGEGGAAQQTSLCDIIAAQVQGKGIEVPGAPQTAHPMQDEREAFRVWFSTSGIWNDVVARKGWQAGAAFVRAQVSGKTVEAQDYVRGGPLEWEASGQAEPSDEEIDAVAAAMPDGAGGMLKKWGYRQFARAVLARYGSQK